METNSPDLSAVEKLAICRKDRFGKVLSQNSLCLEICGHQEGQVCTGNCMDKYRFENPNNEEGTFQFQSMKINNGSYDAIMINDGEQILTILLDLAKRHKKQIEFFKQFQLTSREEEILLCVIKKMTNKNIANKLYISEKTLKTHINNILKKIPLKHWPRKIKNEEH